MSPSLVTTLLPMLATFLGFLDNPPAIVTHLCAPPHQLIEFHEYFLAHRPVLIQHRRDLQDLADTDPHKVLVVVNLSCRGLLDELKKCDEQLNFHYKWYLVDLERPNSTIEHALDLFSNISILQSSEIYFGQSIVQDIFEVKRMFRNSLALDLILEPILEGSVKHMTFRRTCTECAVTASRVRRPVLQNLVLDGGIVISNNDTLNHLDDYHDKHIDTFTKVSYQLTNVLLDFLNASVIYKVVATHGYYNNETGEIDGLVKLLLNREVELAGSPWYANLERFPHVQFISMSSGSKLWMLFIAPNLSVTDNVFLLPFQGVSTLIFLFSLSTLTNYSYNFRWSG